MLFSAYTSFNYAFRGLKKTKFINVCQVGNNNIRKIFTPHKRLKISFFPILGPKPIKMDKNQKENQTQLTEKFRFSVEQSLRGTNCMYFVLCNIFGETTSKFLDKLNKIHEISFLLIFLKMKLDER